MVDDCGIGNEDFTIGDRGGWDSSGVVNYFSVGNEDLTVGIKEGGMALGWSMILV